MNLLGEEQESHDPSWNDKTEKGRTENLKAVYP